jgi:uncharacterized protein (DUF342 family)
VCSSDLLRMADAAGSDVVAESDGRVALEGDTIRLYDVLDVRGDVDFASGSIESVVDVKVHGTVRTNFHVRTTKSLTVDKLIEAAEVDAGENVAVRGGVFGHDGHGHVRAGGSVSANFINEMSVEAVGDVLFQKEVLNSHIRSDGQVLGEHGAIIGGSIYAREGVRARVVGSDAGVTTRLAVGTDLALLRRARKMEQQVRELEKGAGQLRQIIKPLMANLKRLVPAQREQVTELMCKADEIDIQIEQLLREREELLARGAPRGTPYVQVTEGLHAGVRLQMGLRQVIVNRRLHGPVKIEVRKVDDVTEVVAINQRTASVTVLPSSEADLDTEPPDDPQRTRAHEQRPASQPSRPA